MQILAVGSEGMKPPHAAAARVVAPQGGCFPLGRPGGETRHPHPAAARARGFTLLELMVVVALAAMLAAGLTFSLRDGQLQQLEREGLRVASLLDAARAQARTAGTPIVWRPTPAGFEFLGASPRRDLDESLTEPRVWLAPGTQAQVLEPANAAVLVLGPEPLTEPQHLRLTLGDKQFELASNGLRPFAPVSGVAAP